MKFKSACSGCFAGLSCSVRIEIVNLLQKEGKMSVMDIVKNFKQTQPTITHHLQYLKKAGVLKSKKDGRKIFYSVNPKCGMSHCKLFS